MAGALLTRRAVFRVGLGAAVFLGLVALAHMPFARPVLYLLTGGSRCPLGFGVSLTPEQRDAARDQSLGGVRGDGAAASRPALGFELDQTTLEDVQAWAATSGVTCKTDESGTRCGAVPAAALGLQHNASTLILQFSGDDKLVGVNANIEGLSADDAVAMTSHDTDAVTTAAGPAFATHGKADPVWLAKGTMNQLSTEFRFADYHAKVVATNVGSGRIVVRETFQSLHS